ERLCSLHPLGYATPSQLRLAPPKMLNLIRKPPPMRSKSRFHLANAGYNNLKMGHWRRRGWPQLSRCFRGAAINILWFLHGGGRLCCRITPFLESAEIAVGRAAERP